MINIPEVENDMMRLCMALSSLLVANTVLAEDVRLSFGDWDVVTDSRHARYCWLETVSTRFELPATRVAELNGQPLPDFFVNFGPDGLPSTYASRVGISLPRQSRLWLVAGDTVQRFNINGLGDGGYGPFSGLTEVMRGIGQADVVYLLPQEPMPGAPLDLISLEWWVAFSTDGFAEAEAAILAQCAGPLGWNGPQSPG